jgi:chromosomal replication initiation ATPase DnaA
VSDTTPTGQTREIIREVAERHGLTVRCLEGQRKTHAFAVVRQAAYAEVRARRPHLALCAIGKAFGGRDRTTILHGIRTHEARMAWAEILIALGQGSYQPDLFARAA